MMNTMNCGIKLRLMYNRNNNAIISSECKA